MLLNWMAGVLVLVFGRAPDMHDEPGDSQRPNVLFIVVDDLRPALGCYGDEIAVTPSIDRMAERGTMFTRAYAQQAVCSPSRVSVLTGLRPDSTWVWELHQQFRRRMPEVVTLPQHFKNNGYITVGVGKVFDHRSTGDDKAMDARSWSRPYPRITSPADDTGGFRHPAQVERERTLGAEAERLGMTDRKERIAFVGRPSTDQADVADDQYRDGALAREGVRLLAELAAREQPFFLAVGFHRPHLPFAAPARYWGLYERDEFPSPVPDRLPAGAWPIHYQDSWELRGNYTDIPPRGTEISSKDQARLAHGYYASVSFIDAQVGKLLDELERTTAAERTIVVLWSDHGFTLGEHGMYCKHTNYELVTRVPLIIDVPGKPGNQVHDGLVELVDLFPTLSELCGLDLPNPTAGQSLVPLLNDPHQSHKPAAISQFPRRHDGQGVMGYALRTHRYRYIEWRRMTGTHGQVGDGEVVAREFYDLSDSPIELVNVVDHPDHAVPLAEVVALARALGIGHGPVETLNP